MTTCESDAKRPPPQLLGLWKSRLPAIVVPVLAGLRQLPGQHGRVDGDSVFLCRSVELGLLAFLAMCTGYYRLPFSVTWWLVLLAAFSLETELLLGVATVLSLSVFLGWYGVRLFHSQAVTALWGGIRGQLGSDENTAKELLSMWTLIRGWPLWGWHVWDIGVHCLPAALVLYWHGPSLGSTGEVLPGMVTSTAVAAALPMNVLWLWGLALGMGRQWPWKMQLPETNLAYHIKPELPRGAWLWVYYSHWASCLIWGGLLLLPQQMCYAYGVFILCGLARVPYTLAWWILFISCVYPRFVLGTSLPLLEGLTWCCAATTSIGFHGAQVIVPTAFECLVRCWMVNPIEQFGPRFLSTRIQAVSNTTIFWVVARLGDSLIHLVPTTLALFLFREHVSSAGALAALPSNLVYLVCSGSEKFSDTNKIYGLIPEPPERLWSFIYGSHWFLCAATWCACHALDVVAK